MSNSLPQAPMKPIQSRPGNSNKWLPGCLIGCGVVFFLFVVLIALGGWFMATKGPGLVAGVARTAINDALDEIDELPPEERELIQEQVDRVADALQNKDITLEEFGVAVEKIAKSPVIGAVALLMLESQYINDSGLTDEEKAQAARTVQRTWRGIIEESIDPDELEDAFELIGEKNKHSNHDQGWSFKEELTDDELRAFLEQLKSLADEAEVPDEDFESSIGEEIKRIVDELLDKNQ